MENSLGKIILFSVNNKFILFLALEVLREHLHIYIYTCRYMCVLMYTRITQKGERLEEK